MLVEGLIPVDVEVLPVEGGLEGETCFAVAIGVVGGAHIFYLQVDLLLHVLDVQGAFSRNAVALHFYSRRLIADDGIFGGIKEVGGTQVTITLLIAGVHGICIDGQVHAAVVEILTGCGDGALEFLEPARHGCQQQVFRVETNPAVHRIYYPNRFFVVVCHK